jgi:hypothetical protein
MSTRDGASFMSVANFCGGNVKSCQDLNWLVGKN